MNGQFQFGNKKKIAIDDDAPISKKAARNQKKNMNKSLATAKMMQEFQEKKKGNQNGKFPKGEMEKGLDPKQQKKIDDIKAVLENHSRQTIRMTLQKYNYNKEQAMQQLFTLPEDEKCTKSIETNEQSNQISPKGKKQSKQQLANELINDIYQNNEDIDPSEFQQLFAEITDIIKEEEKNQGMDVFAINQFIDNCFLIKNVILENQSEIYVDENDQLYIQTQLFLQQLIKSRVAFENKRKQDFPTLGSQSKDKPQAKSYIEKIQDEYKYEKQKQQYFTPSKVPQVHHHQSNNNHMSVFSIDNNPRSYADILQLSKQYNDMGIDNLKFIYYRLEDINLCKTFLDRFYPGRKKQIRIEKVEEKKFTKESSSGKKVQERPKKIEDQNYKNISLKQIRQQLDHLFKLRSMFRMTRGKTTNVAYRKQLERLACRDNQRIRKLSEVARYKVIQQMISEHPQYIDLHGYREEEIDELFDEISDMLKSEFNKGNSKIETNRNGNNVYCLVKALTGKGLHSKYNKSILKPEVLDWCNRNGVLAKQTEDSINIQIKVR